MAKAPISGGVPRKPRKAASKAKATRAAKVPMVQALPERAYHTSFPGIVELLSFRGETNVVMAAALGVSESTFYAWLNLHPKLLEAAERGREGASDRVERSLFERATGFDHVERTFALKKVKHADGEEEEVLVLKAQTEKRVHADVGAATLWLTNKRPHKWKVRQETAVNLNVVVRRALLELPEE